MLDVLTYILQVCVQGIGMLGVRVLGGYGDVGGTLVTIVSE
jgi:hypothetical protein